MYVYTTYIDKVVQVQYFCVYNISEIIILYSYLRNSDKLLNMFFLLFAVILSVFHEIPRMEVRTELQKKYIELE